MDFQDFDNTVEGVSDVVAARADSTSNRRHHAPSPPTQHIGFVICGLVYCLFHDLFSLLSRWIEIGNFEIMLCRNWSRNEVISSDLGFVRSEAVLISRTNQPPTKRSATDTRLFDNARRRRAPAHSRKRPQAAP